MIASLSHRRFLSPILAIVAFSLSPTRPEASAATLLHQKPMPDDRKVQNLPGNSIWYCSGPTRTVTQLDGSYKVEAGRTLLTYFTDKGRTVGLEEGQTLTVTFSFTVEGLAGEADSPIRFALLNSGNARVSQDNQGSRSEIYGNYTGYGIFLRQAKEKSVQFRERNASPGEPKESPKNELISSQAAYSSPKQAGSEIIFQDNLQYTCIYQLTRTAEGLTAGIEVSTEGNSIIKESLAIHDGIKTNFDTFVLYAGGRTFVQSYSLDNISIAVTP